MESLSFYLKKFKNVINSYKQEEIIIKDVVNKTLALDIPTESIKIINDTVMFKVKPVIKCEIFLKKQELLKNIESAGVKGIKTLR